MLLTYGFSTSPAPLQVSTSLLPSDGRVNIAVFNPSAAYCDAIAVRVFVGTDGPAFGPNPPAASVSTAKWGIVDAALALPGAVAADVVVGPPGDTLATYQFQCKDKNDWQLGYQLTLSLDGPVNQATGQLQVVVAEHSGKDPNNLAWSEPVTFLLDKVTPQFTLRNLVAADPSAPTVPVTEFAAGDAIRLEWESNGTWFEVYAKDNPVPVYEGSCKFCEAAGIETDTTFFVVGQVASGAPGNGASTGYEAISLYDSITVTVSDPVLTPSSVAVSGAVSATTVAATESVSAPTVRAGSITANDDIVGTNLTASGGVVAGSIATSGPVNAATVTASGNVQAGTVLAQGAVIGDAGMTLSPAGITIGAWNFYQDPSGELVVSNGAQQLAISPGGMTFQGNHVICDHDPICIWSWARQAWLNGSSRFSMGDPNGWQAWTYWMADGDGDSNLQMRYGNWW